MFYIIILIIWGSEMVIIPYCSDVSSLLIASTPYFITLPIILSFLNIIPNFIKNFIIVLGLILALIIIYQIISITFFS